MHNVAISFRMHAHVVLTQEYTILCPFIIFRYKLFQMTWQESTSERPSFAEIVNVLINGALI